MTAPRANVYQTLAEVLAEPPEWLALRGCEWPLYDAALQIAPESEAARQAVVAMLEIGEEALQQRRERYAALVSGPGQPPIWFYESGALSGRLFTQTTLEVEQWYQAAGLNIVGSELPDHASVELAFLAYLSAAEGEEFSRIEKEFLHRHVMRWLPDLGRSLVSSGDLVYKTIGHLLVDWLSEISSDRHHQPTQKTHLPARRLPAIHPDQVEDCTLCGFCAQVCPTNALVVRENQHITGLQLSTHLCIGCSKCVRVCDQNILHMEPNRAGHEAAAALNTLRTSPRAICKECGEPLISQAELAYVAARLGDPSWLEFCPECRPGFSSF